MTDTRDQQASYIHTNILNYQRKHFLMWSIFPLTSINKDTWENNSFHQQGCETLSWSELIFNTWTLLKVENRNFSKCSSRDNKTCLNSFQRCCLFFISSSFYCPSNGLFITFILYKPAPVWPHYDYSTALEFQDNYELHCFNKSLGQPRSLLRLHSSHREIYEGSSISAGQMESDALQVNIYTALCEGGYLNLINCLVKVV